MYLKSVAELWLPLSKYLWNSQEADKVKSIKYIDPTLENMCFKEQNKIIFLKQILLLNLWKFLYVKYIYWLSRLWVLISWQKKL